MSRPRQALILLLLALFQVGLLPLQAQAETLGGDMADCACCAPEVHSDCCCVIEESGAGECPCVLESPGSDRAPQPLRVSGDGPRLPSATVAMAAPCASGSADVLIRELLHRSPMRPVARAGPPLYRLYAVDRR